MIDLTRVHSKNNATDKEMCLVLWHEKQNNKANPKNSRQNVYKYYD